MWVDDFLLKEEKNIFIKFYSATTEIIGKENSKKSVFLGVAGYFLIIFYFAIYFSFLIIYFFVSEKKKL